MVAERTLFYLRLYGEYIRMYTKETEQYDGKQVCASYAASVLTSQDTGRRLLRVSCRTWSLANTKFLVLCGVRWGGGWAHCRDTQIRLGQCLQDPLFISSLCSFSVLNNCRRLHKESFRTRCSLEDFRRRRQSA